MVKDTNSKMHQGAVTLEATAQGGGCCKPSKKRILSKSKLQLAVVSAYTGYVNRKYHTQLPTFT